MKDVNAITAIGSMLTRCTMVAGITVAAMYFNKPAVLAWFILVALMSPELAKK